MSELALVPARYGERRVSSVLPGAFELYKSLLPDKYGEQQHQVGLVGSKC